MSLSFTCSLRCAHALARNQAGTRPIALDRQGPSRELPVTWGCQIEKRRHFYPNNDPSVNTDFMLGAVRRELLNYWNNTKSTETTHPLCRLLRSYWRRMYLWVGYFDRRVLGCKFLSGGWVGGICGTLINGENKFWFRVQTEEHCYRSQKPSQASLNGLDLA